jgi:hypothetical protein
MSVNGKYPEQIIAMVTPEMKAEIRAEADERGVSISQVIREAREAIVESRKPPFCDQCAGPYADDWLREYGGHWDTCPNRPKPDEETLEFTSPGRPTIEEVRGVDGNLIRTTTIYPDTLVVEGPDGRPIKMTRSGDGPAYAPDVETPSLAAYAADLEPDTEPDEVDGSLSDRDERVARLRARGLL